MMSNAKIGAALVCCSDPRSEMERPIIDKTESLLRESGFSVERAAFLFQGEGGTPREKARELMRLYRSESIQVIFDISGGDSANSLLEYLDYDRIAQSRKLFCGYSDLTALLNTLYTKTGTGGLLYQVKNIALSHSSHPLTMLRDYFLGGGHQLTEPEYHFIQGSNMSGEVIGGNIRCLLKLAGTPYFPPVKGKILLLEALHGSRERVLAYFYQLKQMGVFHELAGVLLGCFTELDRQDPTAVESLLLSVTGDQLPVARSFDIGHQQDAKAIMIGGRA